MVSLQGVTTLGGLSSAAGAPGHDPRTPVSVLDMFPQTLAGWAAAPQPTQRSKHHQPQPSTAENWQTPQGYTPQFWGIGQVAMASVGSGSVPPPLMSATDPISSLMLVSPTDQEGSFRPGTPEPAENPSVDQHRAVPSAARVRGLRGLRVHGPVLEIRPQEQPEWIPAGFYKLIRHRRTDGTPWPAICHDCTCGKQLSFDRLEKINQVLDTHRAPSHPPNPDLVGLSMENFAQWKLNTKRAQQAGAEKRVRPSAGQQPPIAKKHRTQSAPRQSYKSIGVYLTGLEASAETPPTPLSVFVYDKERRMVTSGEYYHSNPDPQKFKCLCSACSGRFMLPREFEIHGGKASSKKWKGSILVGPYIPPAANEDPDTAHPAGADALEGDAGPNTEAEAGPSGTSPDGGDGLDNSESDAESESFCYSESDDEDYGDFVVLGPHGSVISAEDTAVSGDTEQLQPEGAAEDHGDTVVLENPEGGEPEVLSAQQPGPPPAIAISGSAPHNEPQPQSIDESVRTDIIEIEDSDSDSVTVPLSDVGAHDDMKGELLDDATS